MFDKYYGVVDNNYMKKPVKRYSFDESLGHLTSQASRTVLRRINLELTKGGFPITSDQFSTLIYIWNQSGQAQYMLAESLNKDKTTMARVLASLESLGLIERQSGNRDGREKKVFITPAGNELMQKVTLVVQDVLDVGMVGIQPDELKICKDVLKKFYNNLLNYNDVA